MDINNLIQNSGWKQSSSNEVTALINLPVFEKMLKKAIHSLGSESLKKTAIIYIHHPLQTSVNLIDAIIRLGASVNNIFVLGKHYSECPAVVNQIIDMGVYYQPCSLQTELAKYAFSFTRDINLLWSAVLKNIANDVEEILILDHGGHAIAYFPPELLERYKVIGIEKTTAGLMKHDIHGLPPFPLIGVANSAAKRFLESPLIADAVVAKLMDYMPVNTKNITCGVVGFGAIGMSLTKKLRSMGFRVVVHDKKSDCLDYAADFDVLTTDDLSALIASSDYIFGCSGQDITSSFIDHFRLAKADKTLISCSSEDKEFLSLLQVIAAQKNGRVSSPLNHLEYQSDLGATISVVRGGFPVNFDGSGESVPANDIQLTRSLVLASILQAIEFFKIPSVVKRGGIYALNPTAQRCLVRDWLGYQPESRYCDDLVNNFKNEEWILNNSYGLHKPLSCTLMEWL